MYKPEIKKVVYFVRHGQSEHNVAPVFQSTESPLNATGVRQANNIAKRVSNPDFYSFRIHSEIFIAEILTSN